MTFVFYISGHGFGHASRCLEVVGALSARRPDSRIVVRSSVARWFLERSARTPIEIQPVAVDTGMVQIDSLHLDEDGTALQAARFYSTFDARVGIEAALLSSIGAAAVIGDVPPLAFAAAFRAGIPSIAIGNFTWDWIYAFYPQFERLAPRVLSVIADSYSRTSRALRLPLHGGFEPMMPVVHDIPFIARRSQRTKQEVRAAIDVLSDRPVILASFGAYGVDMPIDDIVRDGAFTLIVTDHEQRRASMNSPRLKRITTEDLAARHLRYEDLVAAADVVASKPGYGIVSECVANGTALMYTSRDRFIEYDIFVEQMPGWLRCRYISPADFAAGNWSESIARLLEQPGPATQPDVDGASVAAEEVLKSLQPDPVEP